MKRIILWMMYLSIVMFPFSTSGALPIKGDVDNNESITLQDAIMAIRIASGMNAGAQVFTSAEVSGDNEIGTTEAIYIFQCLSGLRPACDPSAPRLALDSEGTVLSTVSVAGPGGSRLTLYAGTRIALTGEGGAVQPPASQDNVYLSLADPSGPLPPLPGGITALTQLRIVLTIDGAARDAWFWPASTNGTGEQGLKLVVVADQSMVDGTLGLLFDVASGKAVRVGSSLLMDAGGAGPSAATRSFRAPLDSGSGGSGSRQMQFSPNRTGSYSVGGSTPGTGSAPAGAFWSSFTVPDPGCITVGSVDVCGPKKVASVAINEESTADILADCDFGASDTAATGLIPPGYQFWCERSLNGDGSTDIKISSMQANLPLIRAHIVRASDDLSMFWTYHHPTGGLNGPDGAVYSDPYQKKEFKFAGYKQLIFTTTEKKDYNWMRQHALQPLRDAGYTANLHSFQATSPGFIADIGVFDTLDARVLLQEDVILKQEGWKVRGDDTRGNRGTYKYTEAKYKGTAKATMTFPSFPNAKVWEINAEVTFEKDPTYSTPDMTVLTTSEGTVTQTQYTVPTSVIPGQCYGVPASFTDTYPIYKGDGYLSIKPGTDPLQFKASASISLSTPVQAHAYVECCPYRTPACKDEIMEIGEQQHEWLSTGASFMSAQPDGTLQGAYQTQPYGTPSYEWNLAPLDK